MRITSTANPRVKEVVRLRNRRARDASGTFVIEGYRELRRAAGAGVAIEEVLYCPALFIGSNEDELLARIEARRTEVDEGPFRKMSYRDRPEGLLAVARMFPTDLGNLPEPARGLYLVVESIEKPGNLGTMLRTACACAVDAVIVCDPTTDVFNPNVVRSSIGTLFVVPVAAAPTADVVAWLRGRGVRSYAASPQATRAYWEPGYREPTAIVVGSEQYGLSQAWMSSADETVRIPMPGPVDSLNVAMAAGVLLFEVLQRRGDGSSA